MASTSGTFSCFNKRGQRGHFYSCNDLYRAGVWVGHLAPDKQNLRFKGLSSFNELKTNCKKFSPPFPPGVPGVARDERYAVCRGCFGEASQLITLREIPFVTKYKLVIMPLDGTDDEGMFCILLTQPNDRSLLGLQAYRPYEYVNGGRGTTFTSNIVLLTLRNTSMSSGTLETVCAVLGVPAAPMEISAEPSSPKHSKSLRQRSSSGRFLPNADQKQAQGVVQNEEYASKRRKLSNGSYENKFPAKRQRTKTPVSRTQQPTPGSRETTQPPAGRDHGYPVSKAPAIQEMPSSNNKVPSIPAGATVISLDLTKEQAKRVRLVWLVTVDDIEYDFSHPLANCETFANYLRLLCEDAADDPGVLAMVENSKAWRLTFQLSGTPKKAFTVRVGDNTGFERLQQVLAQSPFWQDDTKSKINVEARPLK